jgi:hypothetical protein
VEKLLNTEHFFNENGFISIKIKEFGRALGIVGKLSMSRI